MRLIIGPFIIERTQNLDGVAVPRILEAYWETFPLPHPLVDDFFHYLDIGLDVDTERTNVRLMHVSADFAWRRWCLADTMVRARRTFPI